MYVFGVGGDVTLNFPFYQLREPNVSSAPQNNGTHVLRQKSAVLGENKA